MRLKQEYSFLCSVIVCVFKRVYTGCRLVGCSQLKDSYVFYGLAGLVLVVDSFETLLLLCSANCLVLPSIRWGFFFGVLFSFVAFSICLATSGSLATPRFISCPLLHTPHACIYLSV